MQNQPVDTELQFANSGEIFWAGIASGAVKKFVEVSHSSAPERFSVEVLQDEQGNYMNAMIIRDNGRAFVLQVREIPSGVDEICANLVNILNEIGKDA